MDEWKLAAFDTREPDRGQDLVEYALMLGFIVVASGALMPKVATSIGIFLNKVQALVAG